MEDFNLLIFKCIFVLFELRWSCNAVVSVIPSAHISLHSGGTLTMVQPSHPNYGKNITLIILYHSNCTLIIVTVSSSTYLQALSIVVICRIMLWKQTYIPMIRWPLNSSLSQVNCFALLVWYQARLGGTWSDSSPYNGLPAYSLSDLPSTSG